MGEKLTFKGFHDTNRLLNTDKFFKLKAGETVNDKFPLSLEKSFAHEITIDKKETPVKYFESNFSELKRLAPDEFGNLLPYYVE